MDAIRLWTIQTPLAWSILQQKGKLVGDGRRICYPSFRPAYRFLREEMRARLPGCKGRYPVWFWAYKPDFRTILHRNYIRRTAVCIECLVPRERVLLLDYDSWHVVLNQSYLSLTEEEFDEFCAKEDSGALDAATLLAMRRESWKRVFDFETLAQYPEWIGPLRKVDVQATVEELRLEEVVRVRTLGRKSS